MLYAILCYTAIQLLLKLEIKGVKNNMEIISYCNNNYLNSGKKMGACLDSTVTILTRKRT